MGFNEITSGLCVPVGDLRYSLVLYSFSFADAFNLIERSQDQGRDAGSALDVGEAGPEPAVGDGALDAH